ncbi:glycosyl hydrolase family 18 protein [Streptomyces orinoci]|uniref:Glycosyl hydrolase family 18 protein n=1 Tax=Streptomyces orinoci TaxID=67339 RepID=A0ABV3JPQ4_STRON|nr:glycosyl hydrolase family 18 protein [Streptomyces orinoci]
MPRIRRALSAAAIALAMTAGLVSCGHGHDSPAARRSPRSPAVPALQAWVHPGSAGDPVCSAPAEYRDGRLRKGTLKAEYWEVDLHGELALQSAGELPCNGFSEANAAEVKRNSAYQYTTVSAMDHGAVAALVNDPARRTRAAGRLTDLAKRIGFTGVDIDFEDFWSWSARDERGFEAFLAELARGLHSAGLRLQVDAPAQLHDGDSPFSFKGALGAGADQLVVMAYGRVFASSGDERCLAIAPDDWVRDAVRYARSQVPDPERLVIGLPSYGVSAPDPCDPKRVQDSQPLTVTRRRPGYSEDPEVIRRRRDPGSGEVRWVDQGTLYDYADQTTMDARLALLTRLGVRHVSVWVLGGGNPWFSAKALSGG